MYYGLLINLKREVLIVKRNKIKVWIVGGDLSYFKAFDTEFFELYYDVFNKPDLVCFTGGTDVNPELYGESPHPKTGRPDIHRDKMESRAFEASIEFNIPMVGICRGAQFLCVMNGGKLIQHVNNHAIGGMHIMEYYTPDGEYHTKVIKVTSTHHQMAYPWSLPKDSYSIVGWTDSLATSYEGVPDGYADEIEDGIEPEVIHYTKTNCLGVQGHPEYVTKEHEFHKYFNRAVLHYLFGR